jgi:hypothetical protein
VPLLLTAFSLALIWDKPVLTFGLFGLAGLLYTALHVVRPRWYVWSAALVSALAAFFTFFFLPIIDKLEIPIVYQLLIGSIFLVVPELFFKTSLSLKNKSRWPAMALGILVSLSGVTLVLSDLDHTGRSALILTFYAVLITLHAVHSKWIWLGYFAATFESLAIIYALSHFHLDLWLPALTLLSLLYYVAGFVFRRGDEMRAWGHLLINSGLVLGALVSLTSLVLFKQGSGWYIILIAGLFAVEMLTHPLAWFEVAVETLFSMALYLILNDFHITDIGYFLFGSSFLWLGGDLILGRFLPDRRSLEPIVRVIGYGLALAGTLILWLEANPTVPTIG